MDNDSAIEKPAKAAFIINIILVVINFILAFGTIALNFSRAGYVEISSQIFRADQPLMGSTFLDIFLRKELSIVVIALLLWVVMKEKKIKPIKRRMVQNIYFIIGFFVYNAFLLYLIYTPVLNAG